jgi:hypothetical protein
MSAAVMVRYGDATVEALEGVKYVKAMGNWVWRNACLRPMGTLVSSMHKRASVIKWPIGYFTQ